MTSPRATALPPKASGAPTTRGGWKNRFKRRGSSSKQLLALSQQPPTEDDNGAARSLSAKRSQRMKKGGGLIRKIKTSFTKDKNAATGGSIGGFDSSSFRRDESDASPISNPQSPFSTESFVTVEVRKYLLPPLSFLPFQLLP